MRLLPNQNIIFGVDAGIIYYVDVYAADSAAYGCLSCFVRWVSRAWRSLVVIARPALGLPMCCECSSRRRVFVYDQSFVMNACLICIVCRGLAVFFLVFRLLVFRFCAGIRFAEVIVAAAVVIKASGDPFASVPLMSHGNRSRYRNNSDGKRTDLIAD